MATYPIYDVNTGASGIVQDLGFQGQVVLKLANPILNRDHHLFFDKQWPQALDINDLKLEKNV